MTMKKRDVPLRVSRWPMFLQDFDYEIEHRSGTKMRHVDALSRVSCLMLEDSLSHRLKQAQLQDNWIRAVRKVLEKDEYEDYYVKHDILYRVVKSCVECIITDAKSGKKEGYLNTISKEDKPLGTFHVDHVGPMETTKKAYNYILVVVDAFSKFVWLYPTKDTGAEAVIDRMKKQSSVFGNPRRIITDRGAAFTSNRFIVQARTFCI
ncbi:PREDICTED: uncharacterized protein LOC108370282 [Rhagoletis zephyria]|uniref:uncharacterized protein LOC108370282 n=1 Tax=Rhagoletis zephyria TaxID=28612 RepID=UPI0008119C9B|nr:PREDICTED: uncharacterized protein LOC108370282 [Rhagoletis zephyria]